MPFGSLSPGSRIRILLEFMGGQAARTEMKRTEAQIARLGAVVKGTSLEMQTAARRSFLLNQTMYTLRRYTLFATTAIVGLGVVVAALGYRFYAVRQTAMVAFTGMLHSAAAANNELNTLYTIAAKTPFEFPDIVNAARLLQPFTNNVARTNNIINALTDALSGMGRITPQSLNRAALAFQHLYTQGRLTGQIMRQLGMDSVPMLQALEAHFHATGAAIRQMISAGLIDATTAVQVFDNYIKHSRFNNAAFLQATQTLPGALSTLRDLIGMSVGTSLGSKGGFFETIRLQIKGLDSTLLSLTKNSKHITFTDLITAIDQRLSPSTHLLLNLFILITTTLKTVIVVFGLLFKAIQLVLWPFDHLFSLFGMNRIAMKLMGVALGILIADFILFKVVAGTATIALEFFEFALGFGRVIAYTRALWGLIIGLRAAAFATDYFSGSMVLEQSFMKTGLLWNMVRAIYGIRAATQAAAIATMEWTAGWILFLALNPITWIVLAGAAILILYFKWKRFHDLVNETFNYLVHDSGVIASALRLAFAPLYDLINVIQQLIIEWGKLKAIAGQHHALIPTKPAANRRSGFDTGSGWDWSDLPHTLHSIFGAANGGTITSSGLVKVGERGPEIVAMPKGASVVPLNEGAGSRGLGHMIKVIVQPHDVYIHGKKLATINSEVVTSVEARL